MKKFYKLFLFALLSSTAIYSYGGVTAVHTSSQDVSCNGANDGWVTIDSLTTTAPTSPYTITITTTPVQTFNVGDTIFNLPQGNYTIRVRDNGDPGQIFPFNEPVSIGGPFPLISNIAFNPASCNGACDGQVFVQALQGTAPYTYIWDDPSMSTNASTGLVCAGTYNVTITDANGCTTTDSETVTEPSAIDANLSITNIDCNGNTGSATSNPSGGSGMGYSFMWSSSANTTNTETGLTSSGSPYTITVTDSDGCTKTETFSITEPPAITVTVTTSDVACFGESTGSATASVSGGTMPYTYTWPISGTSASNSETGLAANTYNVTVVDNNGCQQIQPFTIGSRPEIMIDLDSTDVDCNGNSTGSITATISGGTPNYNWAFSDGATGSGSTASTNMLSVGTYRITVTDALSCTKVDSIVVNEPPVLQAVIDSTFDPACVGGADGRIFTTISGGNPPYGVAWSDGNTTDQDRTGLTAGTYTLVVTDAKGCMVSVNATLSDPAPILGNVVTTSTSCRGGSDGTAAAVPSGGSGTYTNYEWSTLKNGPDSTETGLSAGNYSVIITDSDGCTSASSFTITEPATSFAVTTVGSDVPCFGGSGGNATANGSGGATPYTFMWNDPTNKTDVGVSSTVTNLSSGTYMVTSTDANGCQLVNSVTISERPEIMIDMDSTDVDCNGNSTGSIIAVITGGTPNYSWVFSEGTNGTGDTARANNLPAGIYRITVTDALACSKVDSIEINEPPVLTLVVDTVIQPLCNGDANGSILITAAGGTPDALGNYTYQWADGPTVEDRNALLAGTYTVVVTDINGCTESVSATVTDPSPLVANIDSTRDVSCNGFSDGYLSVATSGGTGTYTYDWGMGVTTFNNPNIPANTYTVTITDANGCQTTATGTVAEPTALSATTSSTDASCSGFNDGTATVTPAGGTTPYTFAWDDPSNQTTQTAINLVANTYTVTVTDANGCQITATATVGQPNTITLTPVVQNNVLCNGDSTGVARVDVVGGTAPLTFLWNDPDAQTTNVASNLPQGTYTVVVTDNNGCNESASVTITEPTAVNATITAQTNPTCTGVDDGTATVSASGGTVNNPSDYTFAWSTNPTQTGSTATGLAGTTYTVTVTDLNGCTDTTSVTLTTPASVIVTLISQTNVSCLGGNDGALDLDVSGGTMPYTFTWADDGTITTLDRNMLSAGIYNLRVTDASGCFVDETYTITEPNSNISATFNKNDVSCNGLSDGNAKVTVSGGTSPYQFAWGGTPPPAGNPNDSIFNLSAGTYRLTITDANGCSEIDSVTITEPNPILISIDNQTNVACNGDMSGSITVSATGGNGGPYMYNWSTTPPQTGATINGLVAGNYTVTVTDVNSCTANATITITEPTAVVATITAQTNPTCNGIDDGTATVSASGGTVNNPSDYTYAWSTTPVQTTSTAVGLGGTSYTVTVTDLNGCNDVASVTLTAPTSVVVTLIQQTNVSCFGASDGALDLDVSGGTAPYTFSWADDMTITTLDRNMLSAGVYNLRVTDASGCFVDETYTITGPSNGIVPNFSINDVSCNGLSDGNVKVNITGGTAPYAFAWAGTPPPAGSPNDSIFNLSAGTYRLTITDANGCSTVDSAIVNQPDVILINVDNQTNVACNGDATGSVTVSATGGNGAPYIFTWSTVPTQTGATISNLTAGSYTVTATDGNFCSESLTVVITEADTLRPNLFVYDVDCGSINTGSAAIRASGGTPGYTYLWSNGFTTDSIFGLSPGNYSVTVTDANMCDSIQFFTINSSGSSFTFTDSLVNDSCNAACNGYFEILNLSGGNPPYNFNWSNGAPNSNSLSSLCAGSYSVTISDASNCDSIVNFIITEPQSIVTTITTIPDTCLGSVGSATASATGGIAPYTFNWPGGTMGNNLLADNYNLTITDANGCQNIEPFTIGNVAPFTISLSVTDVTCAGFNNGKVQVSTVGATNPVTYTWEDPTVTGGANPTNLENGSYPLTVTDANGCAAIDTAIVNEPLGLVVNGVATSSESCVPGNDAMATASVSGGVTPYTYDFEDGNGFVSSNVANNLSEGSYLLRVRDANGCNAASPYSISKVAPFTIQPPIVTPASCNGGMDGTIMLNVVGATPPLTYSWPAGSGLSGSNPTNAAQGIYTVTVTDATTCSETATVFVDEDVTVEVMVRNTQDESCTPGMDGFAAIDISGGVVPYTIDWGPTVVDGAGTDSAFNLTAAIYLVTVTDANMCSKVTPISIGSASDISVNENKTQPSCFGATDGAVTVTASGGVTPYTYDWGGGITGPSRTNIPAGNYSLTITDAAVPPCEKILLVSLRQPDPIALDDVTTSFESCNPGNDASATLTVIGGIPPYTYSYLSGPTNTTSNTVNNLAAGNYTVTIEDASGCTKVEAFDILRAPDLTVSTATVDPTCNGGMDGQATVSITGGSNPYVYNWNNSAVSGADPKNMMAGTYEITVTDVFGCTGADTITLIDKAPITATFVTTDENCSPGNDGSATATASSSNVGASFSYQWPPSGTANNNMVTGLAAGMYTVTVTDLTDNCSNIIPFTIESSAPFTLTSSVNSVSCKSLNDGDISVSVSGVTVPNTEIYQWSPNVSTTNTASNLTAGTYLLTVTDPANNCSETETFIVSEPDTLAVTAVISPVGCGITGTDGAIDITTTGGTAPYSFDWGGGITSEDRMMLGVGNYTVTITDANNCQISESFAVTNQPLIAVNLDSTDLNCNGDGSGSITLSTNANSPTFMWSDGTNSLPSTRNQSNLAAGTYYVTVTDGVTACFGIDSIVVNEPGVLAANLIISDENCSPGSDGVVVANVTGGTRPYSYNWFDGNGFVTSDNKTNLTAGNYMVEIRDANSCSITESFRVDVVAPFTLTFTSTDNTCAGDSMGIIDLMVMNSTAPTVLYQWPTSLPNNTQEDQANLAAGTYVVTVTDPANGCSETASITITEPDSIKATAIITDESCNPGMNGAIDITVTGGDMGPYTFNWSGVPNASLEDQSGLSAGKYFLTITDGNNCTAVDSFIVDNIISTIPNLVTVNDGCQAVGLCAGSAKVDPQGGIAPYSFQWEGPNGMIPSIMDSIGSLCAGNYFVTITDAFNCDTIVPFTILPGRTILPNTFVKGESCNIDNDGIISVTPTGGEEPYTYTWANSPITDSVRTGLAPGNYLLTISDASGCDTILNILVPTESFDYSLDSTDLSCSGLDDGRVDLSIVGGTAGFTFTWSPTPTTGAGTANISDLSADTYFVTITNTANGCVKLDSIVVNPTTPILPNESFTNESCNSANDGSISLMPTGGTGNYTYLWSPNVSSTNTATNLSGNTYNITITDGAGCDTSISITINSAPLITANITTQNLSCGNTTLCDGKAFATPSNGVAPYNYDWGPGVVLGMSPDTAINLCAGNYSVTITDAGGCSIVENYSIGGPSPIVPNFTVTNATCNISNGQLEVNPSGGSGIYTVEWFNSSGTSIGTNNVVSMLSAGAYSVVITDNTGCFETFNTNINDIGAETIIVTFSNVSCFNGNDGSASVSFTCTNPGCTVAWFDAATGNPLGITTNTANGLSAGNYYVEVINNSGCLAVENVSISEPINYQIFETVTDNICGGGNSGSINLNVSGGTGTITYNWSPPPAIGQGTNTVSGLPAGVYSVTVSDANSCDSVMSFTINEPAQIAATFTTTSANCNQSDGTIAATVQGGTVAVDYLYQWFDGNNVLLAGETNPTITNIPSGNYSLRVRDDNVCEKRFNVSLSDANGPTVVVDSINSAGCFGENNGAIYITASGNNAPFTYNWLPNGETTEDITNLPVGRYSVKVTDALGCETSISDTVMESSELMASIAVTEATCGLCNGMATATVTGGTAPYSYLWSNGKTTVTTDSLCGGMYSLVVTDANGCSKSFDFGVNTIGGPTGETVSITPASCANLNNGSATVTPIGGTAPYSYLWQHNNATTNTLNNLAVGTYFLQITDVRGCSRTVQIDIAGPPAIVVTPQVVGSTCNASDGSILLNVSGGVGPYSYNWGATTNADTNFVNLLPAGIYRVVITDASGCIETRVITISNSGVPTTTQPSITNVSCYGLCNGSLVSNLPGGGTVDFRWVTTQGTALAPVNTDILGTVCAGDYLLELTTIPQQCKSYIPVTVTQPDSITLSSSIVKNISCNGSCDGEVFINTRGGNILYTYSWSDPSSQQQIPATGLCAGIYSVTATDANGCTATTSVELTDPPLLTVDITSNTNLICSSDCNATASSVGAGGMAPYSFTWSGGQSGQNPTNLCFGMNVLTLTDARNCSVTDTIFISATDTVIAESFGNPIVCDGDSIILDGMITGSSITSSGWYLADGTTLLTSNSDTSFLAPIGDYTYMLIATSGSCSDTAVFNVSVTPNPVVGLAENLRIFNNEVIKINVSGTNSSYNYNWTPGTNLDDSTIAEPSTSAEESILYTLSVTDTNGCMFTDSIQVIFAPDLEIPSGFSPNGDGNNDVWNIKFLDQFPNASVEIFNRWGQLLYQAKNGYTDPWDGRFQGNALPVGTYYYIIDLKDPKVEPVTGPITIVK